MISYKKALCLIVLAFFIGVFSGSSWSNEGILPNVIPTAKERFISKLARLGLRLLLFAEPPPPNMPPPSMHRLGDDGHMMLDHGASL